MLKSLNKAVLVSGVSTCYATLSAVVKKHSSAFDGKEAALLVEELRVNFSTGRTKSYEWRISQLQNIAKMIDEKERCIAEALYQDLSKPELEAFIAEVLHITLMSLLFSTLQLCTVKSLWCHHVLSDFEYKIILYACNQRVEELDGSRNGNYSSFAASSICFQSKPLVWSHRCLTFQVKTSVTTFPSSAQIVSEPLGVVLVISAWNFPFCKLKNCF